MGKNAERGRNIMGAKTRKSGMIILGTGAVGLMLALWVGCGPKSPFDGGDQRWSSWGKHHGFHGADFHEHVLKHVDDRVKALNLTEVQKEQYAVMRQKMKNELIAGQESRRRFLANVRKQMNKDLPDLHEVAGMVSERLGMLPGAVDRCMSLLLEFYESLDESQKAEVIGHLRDRLNRIPGHAWIEKPVGAVPDDAPSEGPKTGASTGAGSLAEQMTQKRGDRHGELL
jgi:hypothetical protein